MVNVVTMSIKISRMPSLHLLQKLQNLTEFFSSPWNNTSMKVNTMSSSCISTTTRWCAQILALVCAHSFYIYICPIWLNWSLMTDMMRRNCLINLMTWWPWLTRWLDDQHRHVHEHHHEHEAEAEHDQDHEHEVRITNNFFLTITITIVAIIAIVIANTKTIIAIATERPRPWAWGMTNNFFLTITISTS